ncbi:MAG: hypothetical protein WAW97_10075, partial [Gemmiger qucibialis]
YNKINKKSGSGPILWAAACCHVLLSMYFCSVGNGLDRSETHGQYSNKREIRKTPGTVKTVPYKSF